MAPPPYCCPYPCPYCTLPLLRRIPTRARPRARPAPVMRRAARFARRVSDGPDVRARGRGAAPPPPLVLTGHAASLTPY